MKQPVLYGSGGGGGSWFQTIAVSAPSGSSITVSGGGETLTGTGKGEGTYYAFAVHNQSTTYTIGVTMPASVGGASAPSQTVTTGTTSGVITFKEFTFGTISLTTTSAFIGVPITCVKSGTTLTVTPSTTSVTFRVPETGSWVISSEISGTTYYADPNPVVVSDLDVTETASIATILTLTITLHGAKNDTITYTDESGVLQTEVFETGETSKSVSVAVLPAGSSITFASTVADNPDDLNSKYSKTVTVTGATTDIYVMPDHTVYWYGNEIEPMTVYISASGGGSHSTKETNHLEAIVGGNQGMYATQRTTSAMDLTGYSKINFVSSKTCYPTTSGAGTAYWGIGTAVDNNAFSESTSATGNNGKAKRTVNLTSSSGCPKVYVIHSNASGFSTLTTNAIYFE